MEQLFLENIARHIKEEKIMYSAWIHQGKFMLDNFLNSFEESTCLVDEGNIVYLGFREVLDIYVHSSIHTYLKG